MTFRTLSPAAVASLTTENTDEVWLVLLTITHPSLADPILIANNNEDVFSTAGPSAGVIEDRFIGCPFSIELPGEDADEPGTSMISVPNVDREIVVAARSITGSADVVITVVLASSPNTIEVQFPGLSLSEVDWDAATVRGKLRFESIVTEPVTLTITPERFPGLF